MISVVRGRLLKKPNNSKIFYFILFKELVLNKVPINFEHLTYIFFFTKRYCLVFSNFSLCERLYYEARDLSGALSHLIN